MSSTPGEEGQPGGAAGDGGLPVPAAPGGPGDGWPGWHGDDPGCLTGAEVAALEREGEGPGGAEDDVDPASLSAGPVLSRAEWVRLEAEDDARRDRRVAAEAMDAGFTHGLGGHGAGFSAGGPADRMLGGLGLAGLVAAAMRRGLGHLSDDELFGFLGGAGRLESWAAGLKHAAVTEVDVRRAGPDGREGRHVTGEVRAGLGLTYRSAVTVLDRARGLERFPAVGSLLCAGVIDVRKADVILGRVWLLGDEHAGLVLDAVLPRAEGLTSGELAPVLDRAVIAVDPQAARKQKERALAGARVECWAEGTGTSALAGRDLPPAEVIAADKALTADALWLKAHGAAGTMDQLRALAYTARLNARPLASLLPPAPAGADAPAGQDPAPADAGGAGAGSADGPGGAPAGGAPAGGASGGGAAAAGGPLLGGSVNLTMPLSAFAGLTDNPGEVAGYGTADADTCRDLAATMAAAAAAAGRPKTGGPKTAGPAAAGPKTTWCLTLADEKGRAAGHGCAPARAGPPPRGDPAALAAWIRRLKITAIAAGTCDHQREVPGYRIPDSLRHLIAIRSPRCGEPGCRAPARRCDDDHTLAWHKGGKSCECNIHPMCRRSHRTKQAPGWHVTQPEPGILIWQLPSGRTYTSTPEPLPL